ncbi:MAG: ferrochelatase [Quisquiliibacterium sp.]
MLLLQLGTPSAPEPGAVRRYLRQFLSDPRVVEIPRPIWWLILNGIILPLRPRKSAAKYAKIWTEDGSPLAVNTQRQAKMLRGYLGKRGHELELAWAMRYGEPSIPKVLRKLRERNVTRLLVMPLYPQYAGSTTATGIEQVWHELAGWRNLPELRIVRGFHDFDSYLDALTTRVRAAWDSIGPPDVLVISFHGVPRRTLLMGDPYHCECLVTGRLLAARLGLPADKVRVTFQSRFGRAEWLQPYTDRTLEALGRAGTGRVDVVCPGFVSDCLETLEEIAIEGRETFLHAGGKEFRYIPCLNDDPAFVNALADLAERHLAGWPVSAPGASQQEEQLQRLERRAQRARALGAQR